MALYALCLAGGTYIAPLICGFIAEYHGWQWVFYWPSIFLGATATFLFFFMEETNYSRQLTNAMSAVALEESPHTSSEQENRISHLSKEADLQPDMAVDTEPGIITSRHSKTAMQKLALLGPPQPNNMIRRARLTLCFLSWPVVFYAG
jgi:MFS family permease